MSFTDCTRLQIFYNFDQFTGTAITFNVNFLSRFFRRNTHLNSNLSVIDNIKKITIKLKIRVQPYCFCYNIRHTSSTIYCYLILSYAGMLVGYVMLS